MTWLLNLEQQKANFLHQAVQFAVGFRAMPDVGQRVAVFAWEKWVTHILDVIELELLASE